MSTLESLLSNTSRNGLGATALSALANQMQGRLVSKLDADGSGSVDQGEFKAALDRLSEKMGMPVTEDASTLFAGVDTDGDGSLNGGELVKMVSGLLQSVSGEGTMASFGAKTARTSGPEDGLFARLDGNGDGQLSRAEFMEGVNQARAGMAGGQAPVVHRFATFSTFSTFDMGGLAPGGMMPGWMPMGWAPAAAGFQMSPAVHGHTTPAASATAAPAATQVAAASTPAPAPPAPETLKPADALNALLSGADSNQDGQISASELSALVSQLGSQLEAAAQLTNRMAPLGDNNQSAQA